MERVYTGVGGRLPKCCGMTTVRNPATKSCSRFVFMNSSKIIYTDPLFEFLNNACPSRRSYNNTGADGRY